MNPQHYSNATTIRGTHVESPAEYTSSGARKDVDFDIWQRDIERKLKERRRSQGYPKINEISEKIVASKKRASIPAYERLHQQAVVKQRNQKERLNQSVIVSQSMRNTSGPKSLNTSLINAKSSILQKIEGDINYGERMYERNKKRKEEQARLWVKLKTEKEQKELQHATFHPQINRVSNSLVRSNKKKKFEDRLLELGQAAEEKLKRQRNLLQAQDKVNCPFRPQITLMYDACSLPQIGARNSRDRGRAKPRPKTWRRRRSCVSSQPRARASSTARTVAWRHGYSP